MCLYGLVDAREVGSRQVGIVVDAAVVGDELVKCHLVDDAVVVLVGVEHDDREGEHVGRVRVGERHRVGLEEG